MKNERKNIEKKKKKKKNTHTHIKLIAVIFKIKQTKNLYLALSNLIK